MATYVQGNVVRKQSQVVTSPAKQPEQVSRRVHKNRAKALHMSKGYVAFLAIAAVIALFACVKYLQLQSEITNRSKYITSLQEELADAKEENTTRYNVIMNSMNLEEIRDIAMNEFGMVYASADQIIKYQSPTESAVTMFSSIPESGIVASSDVIE